MVPCFDKFWSAYSVKGNNTITIIPISIVIGSILTINNTTPKQLFYEALLFRHFQKKNVCDQKIGNG